MREKRKGQSTLEYVLLVTAVIVVMIGLLMSTNSPFRQSLNSSLNAGIVRMNAMALNLFSNHN
jgi:uncharacterized protein (UPF0333 family)